MNFRHLLGCDTIVHPVCNQRTCSSTGTEKKNMKIHLTNEDADEDK